MADALDRHAKFQAAALVLAEDVQVEAAKLKKLILRQEYERSESLAAQIQRTSRDVKWLMRRLPKKD